MSKGIGVTTIDTSGRRLGVLAETKSARWKAGGVTIDWSTVATNGSDTTLPDGQVVPAGTKYLRYGQILMKITSGGKFGPADTSATGTGRELVTNAVRGDAFVLDKTITEADTNSSVIGNVFDGGMVFKGRLLIGGSNQPTEANFETMFPGITFVTD